MPATRHRVTSWVGPADRRIPLWRRLSPSQLFVLSFAGLIGAGTLALRGLPGLYTGAPLGWLDALFMATSAVCVTGLAVVDLSRAFTPLGQGVLLLLVQLGALGILTFSTMLILALGRRLSFRQREAAVGISALVAPDVPLDRLARHIVLLTLLIEAAGALGLYALWGPRLGWGEAAWPALFHAVMAFCNAGFSTFSDSLIGFAAAPVTLAVVGALVVAGGIGFLTMEELIHWRRQRQAGRTARLSLHSRLVLGATAACLLTGWGAFAAIEWEGTLRHLGPLDRLAASLFMSVTPRTAGFNVVDYAAAADATNFLTVILMLVGGSPGSTAGGIKVTTIALLGLVAWARVQGRAIPSVAARSIPDETIQRAIGLLVVSVGVLVAAVLLLTLTEPPGPGAPGQHPNPFLVVVFEAVSAFGTVGLSMGLTPALSAPGKGVCILLMFLGRVGVLTVVAALARPRAGQDVAFRYAYEDVVVG